MLDSANTLKSNISALSPNTNKIVAIDAFVQVIADFTNQVQAGSNGTAGIFTFDNTSMATPLYSQGPVSDNSWMSDFADAWEAGINGGTITPGTVTDPSWIGSGNSDTNTATSVASTIPNIAAAKATLMSGLNNCTATNNPPQPFAEAIRDATLALNFVCIGLGAPPILPTIAITFAAQ